MRSFMTAALHQQNTPSNIPTEVGPSNTATQPIQYQCDKMNVQVPQPSYPVAKSSPLARNIPAYYPYLRYSDREYANYEQYLNYAYCYPWMQQMYPNMSHYLPNQQYTSQYNPNYINSPITRASQYQHHKPPYNTIQSGNQLPTLLHHTTGQNASASPIVKPMVQKALMFDSTENTTEPLNRPRKMKRKAATRPMNSFMLYSKVHRNKVHSLYPHLDNRTVSKLLGETWYRMESNTKCQYTALAADLKKDHTEYGPKKKDSADSEMSELPEATGATSVSPVQFDETKPIYKLDPTPMQVISTSLENSETIEQFKWSLQNSSTGSFSRRLLLKYEGRINQLPQFDFSNYQLPEWAKKQTQTRSKPYAKSEPSKNITGDFFFGPDFDIVSGRFMIFFFIISRLPKHGPLFFQKNPFIFFFFFFFVEIKELEMHVYNRTVNSATKAATSNCSEYQTPPKQGRCNRLKELILDLFKIKGFFPPQNDIDEFLVSLRFFT